MTRRPAVTRSWADAHYQLGHVLFESGRDLARSVSELREAVRLNPRNTRAHFYLVQALRSLVERETLVEAEQAFRTYLDQGAPLGHEEEVQAFLESRRPKQTKKTKQTSQPSGRPKKTAK